MIICDDDFKIPSKNKNKIINTSVLEKSKEGLNNL